MKKYSFILIFVLLFILANTTHAEFKYSVSNLKYNEVVKSCRNCGGKIIIINDVQPGTNFHNYLFSTSSIHSVNTFTLADDGITGNNSIILNVHNGGFYNVTEIFNSNFPFISASCIDPSNDTMIHNNSVSIMISNNETVRCTFINQQATQEPSALPYL